MFRQSTVTVQQQGVLQEDVGLVDARFLQTRHLWLHGRVALGHLKLNVVAGERNPADTLTTPLCRPFWLKLVFAHAG